MNKIMDYFVEECLVTPRKCDISCEFYLGKRGCFLGRIEGWLSPGKKQKAINEIREFVTEQCSDRTCLSCSHLDDSGHCIILTVCSELQKEVK